MKVNPNLRAYKRTNSLEPRQPKKDLHRLPTAADQLSISIQTLRLIAPMFELQCLNIRAPSSNVPMFEPVACIDRVPYFH